MSKAEKHFPFFDAYGDTMTDAPIRVYRTHVGIILSKVVEDE